MLKQLKLLTVLSLLTGSALAGVAQQKMLPPAKGFFVTGMGESSNCEIARNIAIKNALEKFAGQEFTHQSKQTCKEKNLEINCSFEKILDVDTAGTLKRIVDEKVFRGDICTVSVTIEADRSKILEVSVIGKTNYQSGDALEFLIETKEPLYLYVFNMHDLWVNFKKVDLIFPREGVSNNLINGKFVFPGSNTFKLITYVANGQYSKEQLIFLFTKHKLYDSKEWTVSELESIIKSMPTFSRRVVQQDILIERRSR